MYSVEVQKNGEDAILHKVMEFYEPEEAHKLCDNLNEFLDGAKAFVLNAVTKEILL